MFARRLQLLTGASFAIGTTIQLRMIEVNLEYVSNYYNLITGNIPSFSTSLLKLIIVVGYSYEWLSVRILFFLSFFVLLNFKSDFLVGYIWLTI